MVGVGLGVGVGRAIDSGVAVTTAPAVGGSVGVAHGVGVLVGCELDSRGRAGRGVRVALGGWKATGVMTFG